MLRTHSSRAVACLLALSALLAPVRRSAAQGARPPEPDTLLTRGAPSAAPVYRRSLDGLGVAQPTSDGHFVVLLASGPTARSLDTLRVRRLDGLDVECREAAIASDLPAEGDLEPLALGGQFLVAVVTGARTGTTTCRTGWNLSPVSVWRGAMLPAGPNTLTLAPLATRLRIDGEAASPILAYRRPTFERTDAGWRRQGTQLRYYYDMSVVAPRSDGRPHAIALEIWDRRPFPTTFEVTAAEVDRLALEFVGWKLATTPRDAAAQLDLRPTRPVARPLATILDTARRDVVAAGLRAVAWSSSTRGTSQRSDVLSRFVAAEALLAVNEPELAHAVVASVQHEHPCLIPPGGSSPRVVTFALSNDRSTRCRPVSSSRAAALSIVPGLGNLAVNDRRTAAIAAALVVGSFLQAVRLDSRLKEAYREYQAARDPLTIESRYGAVGDLRTQRGTAIGVGVGLWALDAVSAVWGAHARNRKIADDRF